MNSIKSTLVVLSFNHEQYIKECLDSILLQQVPFDQIIVLDDLSSDRTIDLVSEVIESHTSIEIIRNEKNLGIYGNLKKAYSLDREDGLFSVMSGDDVLFPWTNRILKKTVPSGLGDDQTKRVRQICIFPRFVFSEGDHSHGFPAFPESEVSFEIISKSGGHENFYDSVIFSKYSFITLGDFNVSAAPIRDDVGIWGDWVHDFERAKISDQMVYVDFPLYGYRKEVGISSNLSFRANFDDYCRAATAILGSAREIKISGKARSYLKIMSMVAKTDALAIKVILLCLGLFISVRFLSITLLRNFATYALALSKTARFKDPQ